jgi:FixJ family two-component response regulator
MALPFTFVFRPGKEPTMDEPTGRPETMPPVVYVVDDDRAVREALEDLLASVGLSAQFFGSTQEFLGAEKTAGPGCLVLDVRMPGQSGLEFQVQMRSLGIHLPVIFITGHGDIAMTVRAMKEGAIEFLSKPFDEQALLDAIHQGIEQDRRRRQKEIVIAELLERSRALTAGERDVMDLVVQGLLNRQIAAQLALSEISVKVRRGQVMRKMQATSLADLVRIYDAIFSSN